MRNGDFPPGRRVSEFYLNEPHPTGGNPVAMWTDNAENSAGREISVESATRLLFNDMLGSTLAYLDGGEVIDTGVTLFGETDKETQEKQIFFTGKPRIDELGYSFLFRNYRPEKSKWQTADPLGYPDGWNAMAYCNNHCLFVFDYMGIAEAKIYFESSDDSWYDKLFAQTVGYNLVKSLPEAYQVIKDISNNNTTIDKISFAGHAGGWDENNGNNPYVQLGDRKLLWNRENESDYDKRQNDRIFSEIGNLVVSDGCIEFRQCCTIGHDDVTTKNGYQLGLLLAKMFGRDVLLYNDSVSLNITLETPIRFKPE